MILFKRKFLASIGFIGPFMGIFFGEILFGFYIGKLFERIVNFNAGGNTAPLYDLAKLIIFIYLAQYVFWRIYDYTFEWRQAISLRDLEQFLFKKIPMHSYRFFANTFSGTLVSQITRFLKAYQEFEEVLMFHYIMAFARISLAIVFLAFFAPQISLLLGVWVIFFLTALIFVSVKKAHITRVEAAADSLVTARFSDVITNVINVKSFGRSAYEARKFNAVSQDRFKKRYRSWLYNNFIREFRWWLIIVFFISYIMLTVHLVVNGSIAPAIAIASQVYVSGILGSLFQLNHVIQRTEQLFADAAELTDVLDKEIELKDPKKPEPSRIKEGSIGIKSINFRYADGNEDVFNNFSLHIPAKEKIGIVGPSGTGKSTITKLLLRFFDLRGGVIEIDGQDISNLAQEDLRGKIAYVPQEPILFHRSLKENIRYGRIEASDGEIHRVAKMANADMFIDKLPKGYDTLVGERGIKLSGGEKQRVAIARAMLSDAPILVLDEATSALDSKSEKLIADALSNLMKDRTTIVIAHRLSTVKKLDRIIVIEDSRIIEDGSHQDLMKTGGAYSQLWSHQTDQIIG